MRLDRIQSFALGLPHATVVKQWGECLVFKVAGKMFLILVLDGAVVEAITCKCTPEEFDELTESDGFVQAPYCAKRHWFQIEDPGVVGEARLHALVRRSYDLVVAKLPKKTRANLGRPA
ncbi:MAG TPA: MmcQ/YjbR family DNA-binding protein [Opitutaceae bacterium]|nr:MmcQ/YjbR family DNA-binding protein [Opitutaceae bacterium]